MVPARIRRGRWVAGLAGVAVVVAAALGVPLVDQGAADSIVSPAAAADVPAPYLAAYQAAATSVEPPLPWEILAGIGAVATDHGRRSPYDDVDRSRAPGADYPDTVPPIAGAGTGPLLLTAAAGVPPGADLQDVVDASDVLARAAGPIEERTWQELGLAQSIVGAPLDDPSAVRFWAAVLPQLPVAADLSSAGLSAAPVAIPAPAAGADPTSAPVAAADVVPAGPPMPTATSGADPLARFDADLLANLGDPVTAADMAGLAAWASGEGSAAAFNPFDTTEPEPGSSAFNANGGDPVRDYPDYRTGLTATLATLDPGGHPAPDYAAILGALHQGGSAQAVDTAVAASPWGTRHFPDPTFTALANFPGAPTSVPSGPPLLVGPVGDPPPAVASAPSASAGGPEGVTIGSEGVAAGGALAVAQTYAGVAVAPAAAGTGADPSEAAPTVAGGAGAAGSAAGGAAGAANPVAGAAVAFALAQLGKPYQLGATGPAAFDCSGLVQAAYRAADVALPRTTYSQVTAGAAVPTGDPSAFLPGDLLFIMGADPEGGLPGHVGMVVGPGQVIDAPYTGATVRVTPVSRWLGQLVAVRRVAGGST